MKILIPFHHINDPGGIINHQEDLYSGLVELGHEVESVILLWKESCEKSKSSSVSERRIIGEMGIPYDQVRGWLWPAQKRIPYKGKENIQKWKEFASQFDLILWQIAVPTRQQLNFGNSDWLDLYDIPVKQIAIVHDGNFQGGSPHLYAIMEHLCGVVGVHPCAYHSLEKVPLPRALILNPQKNIEDRMNRADALSKKRDGWFSLQTFKKWKHVDDIIRAIPYMDSYPKILAGGRGIEYYYLTSPDAIKPEYRVRKESDPDCAESDVGKPIWELALEHGMDYLWFIHNQKREEILPSVKFLIDPSWSNKYSKIGDHFNRVVVDGLIGGAVPIARNLGISTNRFGVGELFQPDKHYFMIPHTSSPKQFAEAVNHWHNLPDSKLQEISDRGREEIVPLFDNRRVAQSYIDFALGKPSGFYVEVKGEKSNPVGTFDEAMKKRSDGRVNGWFAGIRDKVKDEED